MVRASYGRAGTRWLLAFTFSLVTSFLPSATLAQPIQHFPIPTPTSGPVSITRGADGNLWFVQGSFESSFGRGSIGRITPAGVISLFPLPNPFGAPSSITAGPDGNLWFTVSEGEAGRVGRITPAGQITEFALAPGILPGAITAGPDGNLWFVSSDNRIGRISPAGAVAAFSIPTPNSGAGDICAGADGNLWFTESFARKVGRISLDGVVTEFSIPEAIGILGAIASGPDGNLWFAESDRLRCCGAIGQITVQGAVRRFPLPTAGVPSIVLNIVGDIASGPDGSVWFIEGGGVLEPGRFRALRKIGRITPDGTISEFVILGSGDPPGSLVAGPDGALWFTSLFSNTIGRMEPTACSTESVCLKQDRFRARVQWTAPDGRSGAGQGVFITTDTGAFWFFEPSNLELTVKVLDGRSINGRFWVFYASLTNVEFMLTVTDTETGASKTYSNPQGQLASAADTNAF